MGAAQRMVPLTQEEIEARAKGYHDSFTDYKEAPGEKFVLPASEREKLETWCRPFLDAGIEIAGGFVFHFEEPDKLVVEKVYCYGGQSMFRRTTVVVDGDHLLKQIQHDYPDLQQFMSDRVGFWHLHPGYYGEPILSFGDVDEIRKGFRECGYTAEVGVRSAQLLVYGNPRNGRFDMGGFSVGVDDVYRFPVVTP